ncbi:MAG: hypothetical protein M0Z94_18600 [Dehalococcoidales bacterium]|nr:hypothetical protein [Dehalococcoidales bacterium]
MARIDLSKICEGMVVQDQEGRRLGSITEIHREVSTSPLGPTSSYMRVSREEGGRGEIYDIPLSTITDIDNVMVTVDTNLADNPPHEQMRSPGMPWKQ